MDGLRSYSHKGGQEKKPLDLTASVDNALTICHNLLKYNVTVKTHFPEDPLTVLGDAQEIEQVFINLIANAVDAMSSLMEPLIMAILGTLIGGLVVAMYLPIFKLGQVV